MGRRGRNRKRRQKKKAKLLKELGVNSSKTSRRKLRKVTAESRFLADSRPNKSDKAMYLRLMTTASVLFSEQSSEILESLKKMYQAGKVSDLVVLAPGIWTKSTLRNRLKSLLEEKGHEWIYNHVVFPLAQEDARTFFLRVIDAYDVTHYFDSNKEFLGYVIYSHKHASIRLHCLDFTIGEKEKRGWTGVHRWIVNTAPTFWRLYEQEEDAFQLINMGFYADETKE